MRLLRKLKNYSKLGVVPLHMPGHKREKVCEGLPYEIDITEIDGFDNLQNPRGVLKECLDRARRVFSSYKTFFSVNGGTCGGLSALATYCDIGDKVIVATNCHKSIYNFIELFNLRAVFVEPKFNEFGVTRSFGKNDFERVVEANLDAKAVVITSPTYEGVISNIKEIAWFLHSKNIPLIVDEAHGSHLFLQGRSAVNCGADIVLNSCHKTLPALTQTALIHIGEKALDRERVARRLQDNLNKFQSSSPSYVLLASIDECVAYLEKWGAKKFSNLKENLEWFEKKTKGLKNIKILGYNEPIECFEFDKTKIVMRCRDLTGGEMMRWLRKMGFELEMSYDNYCLAMMTIMDGKNVFEGLWMALSLLDDEVERWVKLKMKGEREKGKGCKKLDKTTCKSEGDVKEEKGAKGVEYSSKREFVLTIHDAKRCEGEGVSVEEAMGEVAGEYIYAYPPGSPILVPGERIGEEFVRLYKRLRESGTELHSLKENEIFCIKKG